MHDDKVMDTYDALLAHAQQEHDFHIQMAEQWKRAILAIEEIRDAAAGK